MMVTADIIAGCVYILCRRGIIAVRSLSKSDIHVQLQHGLHVRNFLRLFDTELSYVALNSVNILLPFDDLFFLFFSSETHQVVREFCLFWAGKDSQLYFTCTLVIFVFKHYKQLLLRNNCIDGSRREDDFFIFFFSALISCSYFSEI